MKKTIVLGLALAGSLLAAGCGKHDADNAVVANDVVFNDEGAAVDQNLGDLNAIDESAGLGNDGNVVLPAGNVSTSDNSATTNAE